MQIVIHEIDIGTPSEQDTDPEELSVEEQATVVAALDRDRCGLLRRENSMAEASSAMADETTVVREWGSRSYSITDLPFDAEGNRHCMLIIMHSVGSLNQAQAALGQTCRSLHTWFSSRFEPEEASIPSWNTSALTNKEETEKPEEGKASAGITLTPAPAATETTTKDRNAIRALEAAAAASGDASLVEASRLIDTEGAQNAAYALVVTMAAANSCNAKARPVMRTAERAVREVVVSRCCSWPQLRDRGAFLESVEQSFGSPLDHELTATLLVAYHKAVKEKLAGPPSVILRAPGGPPPDASLRCVENRRHRRRTQAATRDADRGMTEETRMQESKEQVVTYHQDRYLRLDLDDSVRSKTRAFKIMDR